MEHASLNLQKAALLLRVLEREMKSVVKSIPHTIPEKHLML